MSASTDIPISKWAPFSWFEESTHLRRGRSLIFQLRRRLLIERGRSIRPGRSKKDASQGLNSTFELARKNSVQSFLSQNIRISNSWLKMKYNPSSWLADFLYQRSEQRITYSCYNCNSLNVIVEVIRPGKVRHLKHKA